MTKQEQLAKAAALYQQALAAGADPARAKASYDAAVARINALPDPRAASTEQPNLVAGVTRAVGQGVTFGFGDEIEAGVRAALTSRTYDEEVERIRAAQQAFAEEYPKTAFAGELVGSAAASAVPILGTAKWLQAGGRAARVGKMVATGAAAGGLSGLGAAEGSLSERLPQAGAGAVVGGTVGPVVGMVASRGARAVANSSTGQTVARGVAKWLGREAPVAEIPAAERRAVDYATRMFERDKGSLVDALTTTGRPNDLVLNRGGRNVARAAQVAQMVPSEATNAVPMRVQQQLADDVDLLRGSLERTIGGPIPNAIERQAALREAATTAAGPLYRPMSGQVFAESDVGEVLTRPAVAKGVTTGRETLRNRGRRIPIATGGPGFPGDAPAVREFDIAPTAKAPKAPKPIPEGQSERGLWLTARTANGAMRKLEGVETEGLIIDLIRREKLDRMYNTNTRKYGPTSAVTQTNHRMMMRIRDILEQRDGLGFSDLDNLLAERYGQMYEAPDRELLMMTHAKPKTVARVDDTPSALGRATPRKEPAAPASSPAVLFDELNQAKIEMDAVIGDLEDKIANGIDASSNGIQLQAVAEARDALVGRLDELTGGRYQSVLAQVAPYYRNTEAFRQGRRYLTTPRDAVRANPLVSSPETAGAYQEGAATAIRDLIDKSGERSLAAARLFDNSYETSKLRTAFAGNPRFGDLEETLFDAIRRRGQARESLLGARTSPTAPLGQAVKEFTVQGAAERALGSSGPKDFLWQTLKRHGIEWTTGIDERAANVLGELVTLEPGSPRALELANIARELQRRLTVARALGAGANATVGGMTTRAAVRP